MGGNNKTGLGQALFRRPSARITWICAIFLLGYVGIEVALGGWIVTFMIRVRNGGRFASGMTATGFWLGITVGRVVLGFITPRIGEKISITVSGCCAWVPVVELTFPGIYPVRHRLWPCPLAGPAILRIDRGGLLARFFPRPPISRGCRGDN